MSLTSFKFIVFFAVTYCVLWIAYGLFHNKLYFKRLYKTIILVASYAFMSFADWRFSICILLLTTVIFFSARLAMKNRVWATIGIIISVLQLGVFKYLNFFVDSFSKLLGSTSTTINIIIPLGVSFYTFSAISYLMDVKRGKIKPRLNIFDVALYLSFFPKLISGPIIRADDFFRQLDETKTVSLNNLKIGIQIFLCGFFKKMVLANHLSLFVDDVFATPKAFSSSTVFLATIAYSLQIYFDFSGYSDIAIGLSKIIGFDFDKNFNSPYLSLNPTEFWKRWHISLSSWLQEYVYYPLGGNRKGKIRTYLNLLLTMMIGGLWHGANWTFMLWGVLHGVALIIHKLFMNWKIKRFGSKYAGGVAWKIISALFTFLMVNCCWVFFRANSLKEALTVLEQMVKLDSGIDQPYIWAFVALLFACVEIITTIIRKKENCGKLTQEYLILDLNKIVPLAIFMIFVGITITLAYFGDTTFIYGQF